MTSREGDEFTGRYFNRPGGFGSPGGLAGARSGDRLRFA